MLHLLMIDSTTHAIEEVGLHDMTVQVLTLDWPAGELRLALGDAGATTLTFHRLSGVSVGRRGPWGPSSAILEARTAAPGRFVVQLQSGDEIHVEAASWSWHARTRTGTA